MADTWQAFVAEVIPASGKSMLGIINGGASSKVIRVYRMWMFSQHIRTSYTGVITSYEIRLMTGLTQDTGSIVVPVAHDTSNAALDGNVGIFAGGTVSGEGNLLRGIAWSGDEPVTAGTGTDELQMLVPLCNIWDTGYVDTMTSPIVLRAGEGVHIKHTGSTTLGTVDLAMEFTQSSS